MAVDERPSGSAESGRKGRSRERPPAAASTAPARKRGPAHRGALARAVVYPLVAVLLVAAAVAAAVVLALPHVDSLRLPIERAAAERLGAPVRIGALRAAWRGGTLRVDASAIAAGPGAERAPAAAPLTADAVAIRVNMLCLLLGRRDCARVELEALRMALDSHESGRVALANMAPREPGWWDRAGPYLMTLLEHTTVRVGQAALQWRDLAGSPNVLVVSGIDATLSHPKRHVNRLVMQASVGSGRSSRIAVEGEVVAPSHRLRTWDATLAVSSNGLELEGPASMLEGVAALRGRAAGQAQIEIGAGRLTHLSGQIRLRDVSLGTTTDAATIELGELGGSFDWQTQPGGWQLGINDVELAAGAIPRDLGRWVVSARDDTITVAGDRMRLEDLVAPQIIARQRPELARLLSAMRPKGVVRDVEAEWSGGEFRGIHANVRDVEVAASGRMPSLTGIDGSLQVGPGGGSFAIAAERLTLAARKLFRAPLTSDGVSGVVHWRPDGDAWLVRGEGMELTDGNVWVRGDVEVRIEPGAVRSPLLDIDLRFGGADATNVSRYYPIGKMSPKLVAWLERAVVAGRVVSGRVRAEGRAADFPFDRAGGKFEVVADIRDGVLDYAPGWPRLENADVTLRAEGAALRFHSRQGRLGGLAIREAEAGFETLRTPDPTLKLHGEMSGPSARALEFLREGPPFRDSSLAPEELSIEGDGSLRLALELPVRNLPETKVEGVYTLQGDRVTLPGDLVLTELTGDVSFTRREVTGRGLRGRLLGGDIEFDIASEAQRRPAAIRIDGRGDANVDELAPYLGKRITGRLDGTLSWTGELLIEGQTRGLELRSDLTGVSIELPEPAAKPAAQPDALVTRIDFAKNRPVEVSFTLGARANGRLLVAEQEGRRRILRGAVNIGERPASLPGVDELVVGLYAPYADLDGWLEVVSSPEEAEADADADATVVSEVRVGVERARLLGRTFGALAVSGRRDDGGRWRTRVDGEELAGDIAFLPSQEQTVAAAAGPPRVVGQLERLYMRAVDAAPTDERLDPSRLPILEFACADFQYRDMQLGRLELRAEPGDQALRITRLDLERPEMSLKAQGSWSFDGSVHRTALSGQANSEDLGTTLAALGFPGQVEGATATASGYFAWDDSPGGFAFSELNGTYQFAARDGRFPKISPGGGGRALGLLNVEALTRRLSLDFSDVFGKGLTFDRVDGLGFITKGDLHSQGTVIVGPAALIEVEGRAGIAAEDYDLELLVAPDVTSNVSLSVLAGLANPVAGAVVFLAQSIFKNQLSKTVHTKYRVTGSWEEPTIERLTPPSQSGAGVDPNPAYTR